MNIEYILYIQNGRSKMSDGSRPFFYNDDVIMTSLLLFKIINVFTIFLILSDTLLFRQIASLSLSRYSWMLKIMSTLFWVILVAVSWVSYWGGLQKPPRVFSKKKKIPVWKLLLFKSTGLLLPEIIMLYLSFRNYIYMLWKWSISNSIKIFCRRTFLRQKL